MKSELMLPKKKGSHKPCSCGCSEPQCCELECLVQPHFFCGQLLTDQDLSVLLDWVKVKSGLARYRHGWGVVCGLDIQCCTDDPNCSTVSIGPGYAVDCCGNDIVVCESLSFDPTGHCKKIPDPCTQWPPPKDLEAHKTVDIFGFPVRLSDLQTVDLYIRYKESLSDPQYGLAQSGCGPGGTCQYTRVQETGELVVKCVGICEPPGHGNGDWCEDYRSGLKELIEILEEFERRDERERIERLLIWLKDHPLREFCFVQEWLCELARKEELRPDSFYEVLFWIIQDWRNHYLRCECFGCPADAAVPLGRIWLWNKKLNTGKRAWRVLRINSYAPYRRPIHGECWPVPAGHISLAPYIWRRVEDAILDLSRMGFRELAFDEFRLEKGFQEQFGERRDCICLPVDEKRLGSLTVYFYKDLCEHRRIVRCEYKG